MKYGVGFDVRGGYRDHLLREHNEVSRRGFDNPVRLKGRELAAVWAGVRRSQTSETALAARLREEFGFPRVSNWEAERRLQDNRAQLARRHRAAARARGAAMAALGTPIFPHVRQQAATPEPVIATRLGTFQALPMAKPAGTVRYGGPVGPVHPALGARRAPARRQEILATPNSRPRPNLTVLCRRSAHRHRDAPTPARPSGIRRPALLSSQVKSPSPTSKQASCPGLMPRSSSAWGMRK